MITETAAGVEVAVRVIPRARRTQLDGTRGDALLLRLAAPPVGGAANDALVTWVARTLGVPVRAVRILSGEHSRHKRVAVEGTTAAHVRRALNL